MNALGYSVIGWTMPPLSPARVLRAVCSVLALSLPVVTICELVPDTCMPRDTEPYTGPCTAQNVRATTAASPFHCDITSVIQLMGALFSLPCETLLVSGMHPRLTQVNCPVTRIVKDRAPESNLCDTSFVKQRRIAGLLQ